MKKLFILLVVAGFMASCSEKPAETESANVETPSKEDVAEAKAEAEGVMPGDDEVGNFGAEITMDDAISVSEIPAMLEENDSVFVKVKGDVNAACMKKGCWMTMAMDDEEMMVRFKDYGFFVPKNSGGKMAVVEGWAYREEIPVADLQHYAEDAGKSKEEIEAITESEVQYTFLADGVIIAEAEAGDDSHSESH